MVGGGDTNNPEIRGEQPCLPSEHPLMVQPRSEGRSRHSQPLFSEILPGDTAVLGEDSSCWPSPYER